MRRAGFVFLPLLLLLFATPALAKQHHVPGEFPTIQAAVDAAEDGDRIFVHKGVYAESVVMQGLTDIQILGKSRPDVEPPAGSPAFTFVDCEQVKIKGLDIRNAGTHAIVMQDCVDGRVKNVNIRGSAGDGVRIEGGRRYRVRQCIIEDVAGDGVHVGDGGSGPGRRAEVRKNKIRRIQGHGVYVAGQQYHEIRKNKFTECGVAAAFGADVQDSRIDRNRIYDNVAEALVVGGMSNFCRWNEVRRADGDGILVSGTDCWVRANNLKKVGGDGVRVEGTLHQIEANETHKVGGDGRVIDGSGHLVSREKGTKVDGRGFVLSATDSDVKRGTITASGSDGFTVTSAATGNLIRNNSTKNSAGEGLVDESPEGANEYKNNSFR